MNHIKNLILQSDHAERKMLGDVRYLSTGTRKPVILFAHGFKGFKDWGHFNLIADWFAEQGFVYCKFNMSHNGTTVEHPVDFVDLEAFSENNLSIELDDLGVIIDWIESEDFPVPDSEVDKNNLFMIGHSRGGGLTILKANEDPRIKAIATWAAISSVKNLWPEEVIKQWEKDGIMYIFNSRTEQNMPLKYQLALDYQNNIHRLDISEAAKKINCPWLIVHGTDDETVNVSMAYDLKDWSQQAELLIIKGATHTLGGGHPYNSKKLLKPTRLMLDRTLEFFENLY